VKNFGVEISIFSEIDGLQDIVQLSPPFVLDMHPFFESRLPQQYWGGHGWLDFPIMLGNRNGYKR